MTANPKVFPGWEAAKKRFSNVDDEVVRRFREIGEPNDNLAVWNPLGHGGVIYFKSLMLLAVQTSAPDFLQYYRKVGNTTIGNPPHVTVDGVNINMDYILSIDEFRFLKDLLCRADISTITEIGAGFGRTCHTILSLIDEIERYVIVDLPEVLELSKAYLKIVLGEKYKKVTFIDFNDQNAWQREKSDVAINIDSFQEMAEDTAKNYLKWIDKNARYFYTKNTVGKFRSELVGKKALPDEVAKYVYSSGLCRHLVDIFDIDEISAGRERYISAFSPGPDWHVREDRPATPFSFYWHSLFERR